MDWTAITYPLRRRVNELTGETIKTILEDVCDNLFNPDPVLPAGRRHGARGRPAPTPATPGAAMGKRIGDMRLGGKPIDAGKTLQGRGLGAGRRGREGRADLGRGHASTCSDKKTIGAAEAEPAEAGGRRGQPGHRVTRGAPAAVARAACSLAAALTAAASRRAAASQVTPARLLRAGPAGHRLGRERGLQLQRRLRGHRRGRGRDRRARHAGAGRGAASKAIRTVTAKPIRRVIVTHYHADHFYGLKAFKDAGAEVWAHRAAQDYLDSGEGAAAPRAARARPLPVGGRRTCRWCAPTAGSTRDESFTLGGVRFDVDLPRARAFARGPDRRRAGGGRDLQRRHPLRRPHSRSWARPTASGGSSASTGCSR